ncbi:hypothetical protein SLEP1_g45784 [Rubroshorea leprosula]|uniref:Uncharacterized protein n=1 Tax=Rubroshorea leprosula TaxID=152421 RepID=A0AAV5LK56_9ROSI|nr:hypothetical protein SLEP1_g45784 [Rubroshorea leprosula]
MSSYSSIEESWEKEMTTLLIDQTTRTKLKKQNRSPVSFKCRILFVKKSLRLTRELIEELSKCKGNDTHESYHDVQFMSYDQLALMMIIDGLFLLAMLDKYVESNKIPDCSTFLRVLSSSDKMLPKDAILEDIVKLENQIPRFVLKNIFSKTCCEEEEYLPNLFVESSRKMSPINVEWHECVLKSVEHRHLLDLLYQYITLKKDSKKTNKNHSNKTKTEDSAGDLEAAEGPPNCSLSSQCLWRKSGDIVPGKASVNSFSI